MAGAAAEAAVALGETEGELGFLGMVCALIGIEGPQARDAKNASEINLFCHNFLDFSGLNLRIGSNRGEWK